MTPPPAVYAQRTLDAYAAYAAIAAANWSRLPPSEFLKRFAATLPASARVLDYGCGIGTDLAWLARRQASTQARHGFTLEGIDGTRAFVRDARRRCPEAVIRQARFEEVALAPARYDGIWCCAALIHVPPEELRQQLQKLRNALAPGGRLGLTLAWGRAKTFTQRDWIPGRYFAAYSVAEARAFLRGWVLEHLRIATDDGRSGRWIQILLQHP